MTARVGQELDKCPCFHVCQVSVAFSDSSAVPGEQINMRIKAQPNALCGVSAVDRSVYIKEPGMILDADKVTAFRI